MAYVNTGSELFKVIKRELYSYLEYRAQEAKDLGKEFTRPIFGDGAIQVLIDVLQKRRSGKDGDVPTIMGKVSYALKMFFTQFLDQLIIEDFIRTPVTLPRSEQEAFLADVKMIAKVPAARRQALIEVIRSLLPKVEGLNMKNGLYAALDSKDVGQFIEFTDVADTVGGEVEQAAQ